MEVDAEYRWKHKPQIATCAACGAQGVIIGKAKEWVVGLDGRFY